MIADFANFSMAEDSTRKTTSDLEETTKILLRRDLELTKIKEKQDEDLKTLDEIAKQLIRRDLELSKVQVEREEELRELELKTKDLEQVRKALMNILEDIDEERKKAESERDKTLSIINNFADGLLMIEGEFLILCNPQAAKFFQINPQTLVGKEISVLKKDFPPLAVFFGALSKKTAPFRREEMALGIDFFPEGFILEVSMISLSANRWMIILHDISREKLVEKMKTEFVSIAAHQLRTPLSAIKWILSMVINGDVGEITEEQKDMLQKTYQSNERMIALVNDLLNTARIEEGKFINKTSKKDIVALAKNIFVQFKERAVSKGITAEFIKPSVRTPAINIDSEKISLAIQNLLDNALEYTKQGKIVFKIEFIKAKNEILFSVADTGIGISGAEHKRIFSKFFRASTAVKTETEGSGLGLFIAKNIIEAHNGRIWFESEADKGTTFYFTLPVKEEFDTFLKEF